MFRYEVQMQGENGAIIERPYTVRWRPDRVGSDEVARACAAEHTVKGGKNADGSWKMMYAGISAVLQD